MHADALPIRGRTPELLLLGLLALCLAPFADKAPNIDDPLFLWAARHILDKPLDFYGFAVNWYDSSAPMAAVMHNPPLASYALALGMRLFRNNVVALHAWWFLFSASALLGTYRLAALLSPRPLFAALLALATPVFLLCATSLMCDVPMLQFWVWAVYCWLCGTRSNRGGWFLAAGLLVGLAGLTKYSGAALVPLLLAHAACQGRRGARGALFLLLPAALFAAYQWWTKELYGQGLFTAAAGYALTLDRSEAGAGGQALVGLCFAGGCLFSLALAAPLLWGRRLAGLGVLGALSLAALVAALATSGPSPLLAGQGPAWLAALHAGSFVLAGLSVLALALADLRRNRDADSLLLCLWVVGIFVFAVFCNWSVNGRSFLPMVPAAGILAARRLGALGRKRAEAGRDWLRLGAALIPAAVLSLILVRADYDWAQSVRATSRELAQTKAPPGRAVWCKGHWGFQYAMQEAGVAHIDARNGLLAPGDVVIVAFNSSHSLKLPIRAMRLLAERRVRPNPLACVSHLKAGAGFYDALFGPLPYVLGVTPPDEYNVYQATRAMDLAKE